MIAGIDVRRLSALLLPLTLLLHACDSAPAAPPVVAVAGVELSADRVVDRADLLSPSTETMLAQWLERLEEETSDQLVVVTLPGLGGEPIENVGLRLGRGWGIGQADKDNGVVLVVAPRERRVRIETGIGLERRLSDDRAQQIIDKDLLPHFERNEMEKGIVAGVAAISTHLRETAAAEVSGRTS